MRQGQLKPTTSSPKRYKRWLEEAGRLKQK